MYPFLRLPPDFGLSGAITMLFPLLLPMLAASLLLFGLLVFGSRKPQYNHVIHTISELGAYGAESQKAVSWLVFAPIGLLLLPIAILFRDSHPPIASLAACISVGYIVAALFPCDPGSPISGTPRQSVHNLGGAVEYVGGGFSLLSASEIFGPSVASLGYTVLGIAIALTVLPTVSVRGLVQRAGEICLFGGLAFLIWLSEGGAY